jgi:hypothetical protein
MVCSLAIHDGEIVENYSVLSDFVTCVLTQISPPSGGVLFNRQTVILACLCGERDFETKVRHAKGLLRFGYPYIGLCIPSNWSQ